MLALHPSIRWVIVLGFLLVFQSEESFCVLSGPRCLGGLWFHCQLIFHLSPLKSSLYQWNVFASHLRVYSTTSGIFPFLSPRIDQPSIHLRLASGLATTYRASVLEYDAIPVPSFYRQWYPGSTWEILQM